MLASKINEEIRDAILDVIGQEYHHRVGGTSRRYHLDVGALEVLLSAVSGAFLLAYLKRLAENAADATARKLFKKGSEKPEGFPETDVSTLIQEAPTSNHEAAVSAAAESAKKVLAAHNISAKAQEQCIVIISELIVALRNRTRE